MIVVHLQQEKLHSNISITINLNLYLIIILGDDVSMLTHTCPKKFVTKIIVAIYNHQVDSST